MVIIKEKNNVTLEIGDFDSTRRGFVITDHNPQGDVVTVPLGIRYKQVKQLFCCMSQNSITNPHA